MRKHYPKINPKWPATCARCGWHGALQDTTVLYSYGFVESIPYKLPAVLRCPTCDCDSIIWNLEDRWVDPFNDIKKTTPQYAETGLKLIRLLRSEGWKLEEIAAFGGSNCAMLRATLRVIVCDRIPAKQKGF